MGNRLVSSLFESYYSHRRAEAGPQRFQYSRFCKIPLGNPAILGTILKIGSFASRTFARFALIESHRMPRNRRLLKIPRSKR